MANLNNPTQTPAASGLRGQLRSARGRLSARLRAGFDESIRGHVLSLLRSRQAVSLAAFWPFDGEPDILPLCRQLLTDGFDIALPVISKRSDHLMQFHSWHTDTRLEQNRFGIFEPQSTAVRAVADFDILIMPLVGYDTRGSRLGMGGGFYDRHLEPLKGTRSPLRAGVAYSLQQVNHIKGNDWDIPLHGIINENGWFRFDE